MDRINAREERKGMEEMQKESKEEKRRKVRRKREGKEAKERKCWKKGNFRGKGERKKRKTG